MHDQLDALRRSRRGYAEQIRDVDQSEAADFHMVPRQLRAAADQHGLLAASHFDGVVGDQPVAAHDEIERALALADAALAGQEHAEAEDVQQHAVTGFTRREAILQQRRQPGDRRGRRERRAHERDAGPLGLGRQLRRSVQAHRHQHARKVAGEQLAEHMQAQRRFHALDEADFALAEHQHAAGPEILVEAGEREAGLLDVRERDAAVEAGGAGEQVQVEAGARAAGAEQCADRDAARHLRPRARSARSARQDGGTGRPPARSWPGGRRGTGGRRRTARARRPRRSWA